MKYAWPESSGGARDHAYAAGTMKKRRPKGRRPLRRNDEKEAIVRPPTAYQEAAPSRDGLGQLFRSGSPDLLFQDFYQM
jgi:hypothetical protein